MKYFSYLFFFLLMALSGCKTVQVIKDEGAIQGNVLFKNLMKSSKELEYVNISSSVMIAGNKLIPQAYIKLAVAANYREEKAVLNFSVLSKPLFDIVMDRDNIVLINHTNKQFVRFSFFEVNFSGFIGLNFNPLDISYFLTGNIPYSEDMQMVSFDFGENQKMQLNITNSTTNFFLTFNRREQLYHASVNNQFFDSLNIETTSFSKNLEGKEVPQKVRVSSQDSPVSMTFLIRNFHYKKRRSYSVTIPKDYIEVDSVDKIKINV